MRTAQVRSGLKAVTGELLASRSAGRATRLGEQRMKRSWGHKQMRLAKVGRALLRVKARSQGLLMSSQGRQRPRSGGHR